jgi:hypothetical protein
MDWDALTAAVAAHEEVLAAAADEPIDLADPARRTGTRPPAVPLPLVEALLDAYERGDAAARERARALLRDHNRFRWAVHLPPDWGTPEELRRRFVLLSLRDQGADTRDELLHLNDLCARARALGLDPGPGLRDAAALSSDTDHYGLGSMRDLLLRSAA